MKQRGARHQKGVFNAQERFVTGISGLDAAVCGGLLKDGLYAFIGAPGTGKTTLAGHIAFNHISRGGRVIYVTVLTETHTRLLAHLRQFDFFREENVGTSLFFISAYEAMQDQGSKGISELVRPLIRSEHPSLIILDGVPIGGEDSSSDPIPKRLFRELQTYSEFLHCTTLVLSPSQRNIWESRALMLVDGAFELIKEVIHGDFQRSIEVQVFRGSRYRPGPHKMILDHRGISIPLSSGVNIDTCSSNGAESD